MVNQKNGAEGTGSTPSPGEMGLLDRLTNFFKKIPGLFTFSWLITIPLSGLLGIIVGIGFYVKDVSSTQRGSVIATALGIVSASALVGGFFGFLFGILGIVEGPIPATGIRRFVQNTKLDQISDWLTKIIVGLGLTQISHIGPILGHFGNILHKPLGSLQSSAAFGLTLTISYALMGFFYLYLWSRTMLVRELATFDPDLLKERSGTNE
jgi:hypothetical protein